MSGTTSRATIERQIAERLYGDSSYEEPSAPARRPALVVGLDREVTAEQAHEVKAQLQERLPDVEVVLVSRCTSLVLLPGGDP